MIDRYLGLGYEEIRSRKIARLDKDLVNEFYKELYTVIPEIRSREGFAREYFFKYLEKIIGDAEILVRLRISKAVLGAEPDRDSIDYEVLKGIDRIACLLRDYLSGRLLLTPDHGIVVRAKKDLVYRGRLWRRGDIGSMDLVTAAFYYALDMVKPVQSGLTL